MHPALTFVPAEPEVVPAVDRVRLAVLQPGWVDRFVLVLVIPHRVERVRRVQRDVHVGHRVLFVDLSQ